MIVRPTMREKIQIFSNTCQIFGLWYAFKQSLIYLLEKGPKDTFDEKYGLSTLETVETSEAEIADATERALAIKYVATSEPLMRHVLTKAKEELNLNSFSFIDLGCGKGRALIMAAQLPFKEVIGVELSPLHSKAAEGNIERFMASKHPISCKDIRVVCANAIDFEFPNSNLLIYMYRPFLSAVVSALAKNLYRFQATTGYRVLLAYSCPLEESVFDKHPGYIKLKEFQTISIEKSWSLWECRIEELSPGSLLGVEAPGAEARPSPL